jgi:dUTP pyrophosphatase
MMIYHPSLMETLKVKRLNPSAHLPEKAREGDLGFDLFAVERVVIPAGEMRAVGTGIGVEFPKGWGGLIRDRSSMALKRLTTSAGVIDNGYRGEIKILITNHSRVEHSIEPDQKIAQMIPCPVTDWKVEAVAELDDSHRGEGGFGSTGAFKSTN